MFLLDADREFIFDKSVGRYRYKDSGKFAPEKAILNLSQKRINETKKEVKNLNDSLYDGSLNLEEWQRATSKKLKTLHIENSALGKGGLKNMNNRDYSRIGGTLKNEYKYLKRLSEQIKNGEITEKQARERINKFVKKSRFSFFESQKITKEEAGYKWMRRRLSIAEHCPDCINYANAGWQPIGTLPQPTQACRCQANCVCYVEYSKSKPENDSLDAALKRFQNNIGWIN